MTGIAYGLTDAAGSLLAVTEKLRVADARIAELERLLEQARGIAVELEGETITARAKIADAWDEGYAAAEYMARCWGHVDSWEDEPTNPHRAAPAPVPGSPS